MSVICYDLMWSSGIKDPKIWFVILWLNFRTLRTRCVLCVSLTPTHIKLDSETRLCCDLIGVRWIRQIRIRCVFSPGRCFKLFVTFFSSPWALLWCGTTRRVGPPRGALDLRGVWPGGLCELASLIQGFPAGYCSAGDWFSSNTGRPTVCKRPK